MEFFQYLAPTKVIFGRGTEARTGALCKEAGATKVLIHYGGHSAKKSGLIDRICASLQAEGISYTELGGVVPNPELTYTLPAYQTASGCTDIIVHSLERFFTKPDVKQLNLTDGIAETLIKNVMRNVKAALKKPDDYDARAEIMWSGTLSHNDITGDRTLGDWACHQLEHELGGMFDIAHGAGLAAVWGSWARYVMPVNPARFAQLAVNVFGIPYTAGAEEKIALEGIEAMEAFFKSIGMPTKISDMDIHLTDEQIKELAYKCSFNNTRTIGGFKALNIDDMEKIYQMAK